VDVDVSGKHKERYVAGPVLAVSEPPFLPTLDSLSRADGTTPKWSTARLRERVRGTSTRRVNDGCR
jgi:hypothetical protein